MGAIIYSGLPHTNMVSEVEYLALGALHTMAEGREAVNFHQSNTRGALCRIFVYHVRRRGICLGDIYLRGIN
jgi:hypothetical protein